MFACGGLIVLALIISKKFQPAAGFYYFYFLKIFLLLLFSKIWPKFPSAFIILLLRGVLIINTPVPGY